MLRHVLAKKRLAQLLGYCALIALPLLLDPTAAGAIATPPGESGAGARILSADVNHVRFEVVTPPLRQQDVLLATGRYQRLEMAGYSSTGEPGRPAVPQQTFLIGVPAGAEVSLTVEESDFRQLDKVVALPGSQSVLLGDAMGDVSIAPEFAANYPLVPALYEGDATYPQAAVHLGPDSMLRDLRTIQVVVNPVLAQPGLARVWLFERLKIRLDFTYPSGAPPDPEPRAESGVFEKILADAVLNYQQARSWPRPPAAAQPAQASPCLDANAFRITVAQTGIYELTHADLAAQGLPTSVPADKVRMCYEDHEIAIRLEDDNGNGNFDDSDRIAFYAEGIKTQETTTNVYWLTYALGSGAPDGLRMAAASDGDAGTTPSYHVPVYHLEQDTKYYSLIPWADLNDHWYWAEPLHGDPDYDDSLDIAFTVNNKFDGSYDFTIRAQIFAFANYELHVFELRLNGMPIGQGQFTGGYLSNPFIDFEASAPAAALANGNNTLTIVALDNDGNPNNPGHRMLINWVEIEPRRLHVAEDDRLAFEQQQTGSANFTFSTSGFTAGAVVQIFDVSDPANPTIQAKQATGGNVAFNRAVTNAAAYALTTAAARLDVASIAKDTLPNPLLASAANQADYIMVTDPSLAGALVPLRNQRLGQGLTVKTIYVQDVFDEFSYGRYSTEALRDFLAYTASEWQAPAPTYVLLAGEASYDHRNVLGGNGSGGNVVPVYLRSGVDTNLGEAAADNQYVDFNGDNLADMLLGRLPALDSIELATMVGKILTFENNPPGGPWRGRHLFLADNGFVPATCAPDPAADFFALVNDFVTGYMPASQIAKRLYYAPADCYPNPTYPVMLPHYASSLSSMQNRLVQNYNDGNVFVSYTGHSGTLTWGHEGFLTPATIAALANGGRTPIMLPMTCLEGIYHFPLSNNISELLLKHQSGGAVASYAPTGLQVATGHVYLLEGFYDGVYQDGDRILGTAVYKAKLNLVGQGAYQDLHDTYMLLGDPAMQINMIEDVPQVFTPVQFRNP